jgi:uncharacterized protein (UPF0332 family)
LEPGDLLKAAERLVNSSKGKPVQAYLRRAVSTTYYAMFHTLARCCADLLIGGKGADRSNPAWKQVYRALEHGQAKSACANTERISKFPKEIRAFAENFVTLQGKRHLADYDPTEKVYKSTVESDIGIAQNVINKFQTVPVKDRRAFAAHVLFKART